MWQEAKKQEKKLRGIMIDYKKRAERRRDFYASIRADPASFLQVHGHSMKIHIDQAISAAAESSLMPWMGDDKNMIDRFDARAHLDNISLSSGSGQGRCDVAKLNANQECQLNYERYRDLVQNDFGGVDEAKCLDQILLQERFGQVRGLNDSGEMKKKLSEKSAAIGYNYHENNDDTSFNSDRKWRSSINSQKNDDDSDEDEEEFTSLDNAIDVAQLSPCSNKRLVSISSKYGIPGDNVIKFMKSDHAEAESNKLLKECEMEKSAGFSAGGPRFSGNSDRPSSSSSREKRKLEKQQMMIMRSFSQNSQFDHFGGESTVNGSVYCNSYLPSSELLPKVDKQSGSSDDDDDNYGIYLCFKFSNFSDDFFFEDIKPSDEGKITFITSFGSESSDESDNDKPQANLLKDKQKNCKPKLSKSKKKKLKNKRSILSKNNESVEYGPRLDNERNSSIKFNSSASKSRRYRDKSRSRERSRTPIPMIYQRRLHQEERRSPSSPRSRQRRSSSSDRESRSKHSSSSKLRRNYSDSDSSIERSPYTSRSKSKTTHQDTRFSPDKKSSKNYAHSKLPECQRSHSKSQVSKPSLSVKSKSESPVSDSDKKLLEMLKRIETKAKQTNNEASKSDQKIPIENEQSVKFNSPTKCVKRYYRHDLAHSESTILSDQEDDQIKEEDQTFSKKLDNLFSLIASLTSFIFIQAVTQY